MRNQFKFSKTLLDKVKPKGITFEVSDPTRPGMRCRIRPNGTKSVYVIKALKGKRIKYTIGLVSSLGGKDIENLYRKALLFIENGLTVKEANKEDKATIAAKNALNDLLDFTVSEAIEFTKGRKKRGGKLLSDNSIKAYDRLLKNQVSGLSDQELDQEGKPLDGNDIGPDWTNKPIRELTFDEIEERFDKITDNRGEYAANNFLRLLRSVWHYVSDKKKNLELEEWPVKSFENTWHKEHRRKTFISTDDLPTWYSAVNDLSDGEDPSLARDYLLFAICTGLRRREITHSLLVENVDLKRGVFSLEITKSDRVVELPTNTVTKEILKRRILAATGSRVFPIAEPKKFINRVAEASEVPFTSHDLRRCFASYANLLDVPNQAIKAFLTHASGYKTEEVTDGYIVMDIERLRVYSQRIADFVTSQSEVNNSAKVVTIVEAV